MARKTYHDNTVRGMDVYGPSFSLPPGYFVGLNNIIPYGTGGGKLRDGYQGQLTTPRSGPLWFPMDRGVRMPAGTASRIVFASAGKLYYSADGSATSTEIKDTTTASLALPDGGEHCQIVQDGQWLYGIEGSTTGRLFRIDTDAGTWAVEWLQSISAPSIPSGTITRTTGSTRPAGTMFDGTAYWAVSVSTSATSDYPIASGKESAIYIDETGVYSSYEQTGTAYGEWTTQVTRTLIPPAVTTGNTYYLFWRKGGTLSDNLWHLIAAVPVGANASGTGYSWNFTTKVFTDTMLDSELLTHATLEIGEELPAGMDCIATHAGCLWTGDDNTVYKSRLLTESTTNVSSGLFWDLVPDLDAANVSILGASFTLGAIGGTRDRIKYLASVPSPDAQNTFGSILYAFREHSITPIKGTTALDIVAGPTLDTVGRGLISRRGITYADGAWWYNSADGPMMFDSRQPTPVAIKLGGLVTSKGLGNAAGVARVAFTYYDYGLWAMFPDSDDVYPSRVYLWRKTENDWCYLTSDNLELQFTGGVVLTSAADTGKLYLAGADGQLYLYTGTADKVLPGDTLTEIEWTVLSRSYGLDTEAQGRSRYAAQSPRALFTYIDTSIASSISWSVTSSTTLSTTGNYSLAAGINAVEITSLSDVRGNWHQVTIGGSVAGTLRFGSLSLEVIEQTTVR